MISLLLAASSYAARAAGDTKGAELLAQARAAIGGEKRVAAVKGLSCAGTIARDLGGRRVSGELTLDLQLPDKMLRTESISPMGDGALVVTEQGVNGDALLRRTSTRNAPPGLMIRTPPTPAAGSDAEAQALRNSRAELARMTLALLLSTPSTMPIDVTSAGEAESPDGKADVLDLKGPGSFAAQLFLDKTSHRPLMLMYRGIAPRMIVQRREGPPPSGAAPRADADPPAPDTVDITLYFDDYRAVDGVLLPHHIARAVGGETNEEWTFTSVKVNPAFKPDTFAAR